MLARPLVLLAVLALAGAAAGCGSGEEVRPLPEGFEGTIPQETATETEEAPEPSEPTEEAAGGEGDPEAGAQVFAEAGCGACHTLADAGTSGTIGPNLDESQPSFDLAVDRVTNGQGAMPAFGDQLSDDQIRDVAAYVVEATGG